MNNTHQLTHISDVLSRRNKPSPPAIQTGYILLDMLIGGLNSGSINLIASRPGMGKSSFALNIASNVAKLSDISVAYISLEQCSDDLTVKLLSIETGIDLQHISNGTLSSEEQAKLLVAETLLSKRNIYFTDVCSFSATDIMAALRNIQNLGLVIIDYVQLLILDGKTQCVKGKRNRELAFYYFTEDIRRLAIERNISIILLSQLNRSVEERDEEQICYRPALWALRKSSLGGCLESVADVIMFPYRDSYYDEETDRSTAECIIAKNRYGNTGTIPLHWNSACASFSDA